MYPSGDYFIYGDLYKIDDGNVKNLSLLDANDKKRNTLACQIMTLLSLNL